MGLRDKSRQAFRKISQENPSLKAIPTTKKGLRSRVKEALESLKQRKSLRQRAQELLAAKKIGGLQVAPEKPHKGLKERAQELLQKLLGKSEDEKKKSETPTDSLPEPEPLELTPPPQPNETILENIIKENEEKPLEKDWSASLQENIKSFFEKLAQALQGVEIFVSKDMGAKVQEKEETKASPFFDDEITARRPGKSWFSWQEEYPKKVFDFIPQENLSKEPYYIHPQKAVIERKDIHSPMPLLLSYRPEDIARGRDYIHLRDLKSAEEFLKLGEFTDSLTLLYHTLGNLQEVENKTKLKQNIQDIEDYIKEEKNRLSLVNALSPKIEPSVLEQKIERAQFEISSAQMQAANIQITSLQEGNAQMALKEVAFPAQDKLEGQSKILSEMSTSGKVELTPVTPTSASQPQMMEESSYQKEISLEAKPQIERELTQTLAQGGGALETEGITPQDKEPVQEKSEEKTRVAPALPLPAGVGGEESSFPTAQEEGQVAKEGVLSPPVIPPLASSGEPSGSGQEEIQEKEKDKAVQEIRGVLELKPPEEEDTPFLTLTYDFQKIPHEFILSRDHQIFEYAYYKYKPMLLKAQKYIKRKQITKALNYYRVIREQQIPPEFRRMIDQNIKDITEYLQKYLMARQ